MTTDVECTNKLCINSPPSFNEMELGKQLQDEG